MCATSSNKGRHSAFVVPTYALSADNKAVDRLRSAIGCIGHRLPRSAALLGLAALLPGCATTPDYSSARTPSKSASTSHHGSAFTRPYRVRGHTYHPLASAHGYRERGIASWYGAESGNRTATGSRFDPHHMTAAHRTLPLPTRVRVTNLANRRSIEVVVNDRGPFHRGRIIDLSQAAAKALHIRGTAPVEVVAVD